MDGMLWKYLSLECDEPTKHEVYIMLNDLCDREN